MTDGDQPSLARETLTCPECGAHATTFEIGLPGVQITDVATNCPQCGATVSTPGGRVYQAKAIDGRLQMLFYDMTADEIAYLRQSVQIAAGHRDATASDIIGVVEQTAPGLAAWIRDWVGDQQNRMELYTVLTFILAVLAFANQMAKDDATPPPPTVINQFIGDIENGNFRELPLPEDQECFCNSGERYDQCHGRHPGIGDPLRPR